MSEEHAAWPMFNAGRVCPKCAGDDISTRYCRGRDWCHWGEEKPDLFVDWKREHMHRYCRCCSYQWLERTIAEAVPGE